eukprot:scaffold659554_cov50-Prasinocladus_malaysianus.AAC.1
MAMLLAALPDIMDESIWVRVPWTAWGAVIYTAVMISFVAHTGQAWAVGCPITTPSLKHAEVYIASSGWISYINTVGSVAVQIKHLRPIIPALFGTCQPPLTIVMA